MTACAWEGNAADTAPVGKVAVALLPFFCMASGGSPASCVRASECDVVSANLGGITEGDGATNVVGPCAGLSSNVAGSIDPLIAPGRSALDCCGAFASRPVTETLSWTPATIFCDGLGARLFGVRGSTTAAERAAVGYGIPTNLVWLGGVRVKTGGRRFGTSAAKYNRKTSDQNRRNCYGADC